MEKVYFDNISATKILPEVKEEIISSLELFGNPQSIHQFGRESKEKLENARKNVSSLINALPEEIIFTSCGSESNNLALKGIAAALKSKGNHIITSSIEHLSILHPLRTLKKQGFEVTEIPVDKTGLISPDDIKKAITDKTILVSIQHANPEIGTIQNLKEISKVVKEKDIIFHTDAVCSVGEIEFDVKTLNIDLASFSAQNFYGPSGIAALFIKKGIKILPQIEGGIQERGFRSGLENILGIIGMGKAAEIAMKKYKEWNKKLIPLRDKLLKEVPEKIEHVVVTGNLEKRLPGHVSFCIEFIEGEAMLLFLDMDGISATSGSACTSKALKASHVLLACGLDHAIAQGSLVLSLGINNTEDEINYFLEKFPDIVKKLREMSPLYAKYLKGKSEK